MEKFIEFAIIFVIVLTGSYSKDLLDIIDNSKEDKKIDLLKILVSTIGTTIILYSIAPLLEGKFDERTLMVFYYISGLGSYKLIKTLTRVKIIKILPIINELIIEETKKEQKENEEENEEKKTS